MTTLPLNNSPTFNALKSRVVAFEAIAVSGNQAPFSTWAELSAVSLTGYAVKARFEVVPSDTGTHSQTVGGVTTTEKNSGVYSVVDDTGTKKLVRIYDYGAVTIDQVQVWAKQAFPDRICATYGDRGAIPSAELTPYLKVRVIEPDGSGVSGREFLWVPAGDKNPDTGVPVEATDWAGLSQPFELRNRGNHTGVQGQDTILGLTSALNSIDGALSSLSSGMVTGDAILQAQVSVLAERADFARMSLDSFSVTPATAEVGDTLASLAFAWGVSGGSPNAQVIERADGQRVWSLTGADRSVTAAAPPAAAGLLVIGDSQSDHKWEQAYADWLGLTLVRCALYSQGSRKQALRVGAYRIGLTLAGNVLPAVGTAGTVTLLNGLATIGSNPDAILHASDPDTVTHTIAGTLTVSGGTRHVTITHAPGSAPNVYTIMQDGAGGAVSVSADALFVPDFKAMLQGTHRVAIMVGHNSMSGSNPTPAFAGIRADIDAIMALRGSNIVELNGFFPADTPTEIALIPGIITINQWMRDKYPGAYMVDVNGRDLYQRLLFEGGTTQVISASYRDDELHLNATGNAKWLAFQKEVALARFAGAASITATTSFTARLQGAVSGYAVAIATRTVTVTFQNRRFWGVSASATLDSAGIRALAGTDLSNSRALSRTVTAAGEYVYYAYPASLGDPPSWTIGSFSEVPVMTTVSVTKANGAVVSYRLLRSINKLTGSVILGVQ